MDGYPGENRNIYPATAADERRCAMMHEKIVSTVIVTANRVKRLTDHSTPAFESIKGS